MAERIVLEAVGWRIGEHQVLDDVSLAVDPGEMVALIGPNGGGKSSLLMLLAGLVRPSAGQVLIDGEQAHRLPLERPGSVALITARPGLYPLLTGRENLAFFGSLYGWSPDEVMRRAEPLCERLQLAGLEERVGGYSSGMQQKLSLVRALIGEPSVLLLDEATSNLDPLAARTIEAEATAVAAAGACVVWVTHDLYAASAVAHRVVCLARSVVGSAAGGGVDRPPSELMELFRCGQEAMA